jgi:hypothetical protein
VEKFRQNAELIKIEKNRTNY